MYLYTTIFEICGLSDTKLLCRFTVILRSNSIHQYDVVSNIVANNIFLLIFQVNVFLLLVNIRASNSQSSVPNRCLKIHRFSVLKNIDRLLGTLYAGPRNSHPLISDSGGDETTSHVNFRQITSLPTPLQRPRTPAPADLRKCLSRLPASPEQHPHPIPQEQHLYQ